MVLKPTNNNNMSVIMKQISFASDTKLANFGEMKKVKPIVRNLAKRKALPGDWYYSNAGNICGPYSAQTLRGWLESDSIGPSIEIRMGDEGDFADLQYHFPNIEDAFCVPSLLCVHLLSLGETMFELKGYSIKIERHVDDLCTLIEAGGVSFGHAWIGDYNLGMLSDIAGYLLKWKADQEDDGRV
jgi:hypothetical protein